MGSFSSIWVRFHPPVECLIIFSNRKCYQCNYSRTHADNLRNHMTRLRQIQHLPLQCTSGRSVFTISQIEPYCRLVLNVQVRLLSPPLTPKAICSHLLCYCYFLLSAMFCSAVPCVLLCAFAWLQLYAGMYDFNGMVHWYVSLWCQGMLICLDIFVDLAGMYGYVSMVRWVVWFWSYGMMV